MRSDGRRRRLAAEDGFTMMFVIAALFVGTLLAAAAFTAALGDIKLSGRSELQERAYYAAQAGIQRYQHELTANPNYWVECPSVSKVAVPATTGEEYSIKTLPSEPSTRTACEAGKQATVLESSGPAKGTFRILSTGVATSGTTKSERKIVATFSHPGFTKYVYETNYEVEDPANFEPEPTECEHYYSYRKSHTNPTTGKLLTEECGAIQFAPTDEVKGPMHTNDAADVCASGVKKPKFGRTTEDPIEMNGGHYALGSCTNEPNIVGTYTESAGTILPPETDVELLEAAGLKFEGRTELELHSGTPNTITGYVTNQITGAREVLASRSFPANGVIYVTNSSKLGCHIKYTPFGSDTYNDQGCGDVYVRGTYSESLTIASEDDVIVDGNITTTTNASKEPTGGAALGLIAQNFVRVYHPVKRGYEAVHATPAVQGEGRCMTEITGSITSGSTSFKSITTATPWGVATGYKVEGSGIESGTTISSLNEGKTEITLSKAAKKTETVTVKIYGAKGKAGGSAYELDATNNKCHQVLSGYAVYISAENLYLKSACETGSKYAGEAFGKEAFCEYTNSSKECSSKATNLSATEDMAENGREIGTMNEPVIDAAILSTKHSWIVDNYKCGAQLGKLTVWGSIAQYWRGPVGTAGGSGYIKDYNYDQRLASEQPPDFLSPTSTTWHLSRQTAPPANFTG